MKYFLALTLFFLFGCNFRNFSGQRGMSINVERSKINGLFIDSYIVPQEKISINDTLSALIDEVWLEKKWKYKNKINEFEIDSGFQLCVVFKNNVLRYYDEEWDLRVNSYKLKPINLVDRLVCDFNDSLINNGSFQLYKKVNGKFELNQTIPFIPIK